MGMPSGDLPDYSECPDCGFEVCQCDRLDDIGDHWEDAMMNCGLVGNTGLCTKAGSEECDWECPFSH
jgi:hypothetical protein